MSKPATILDNKRNRVIDELKVSLIPHSKLSVISAYFTIYAYQALKKELSQVDACRFILTEPFYAKSQEKETREYIIQRNPLSGNAFELKLRNEMKQAAIARECAAWVQAKGQFKSLRRANPAQPRLVHVSGQESIAINGSVDFTADGLGVVPSNRIDYNTCMYGTENTNIFLQMFDELWNDTTAVEDITEAIIADMQVMYRENAPELVYYLMLYHIFYDYLDELNEENIIKSGTGFKNTKVWQMLYKFQRDGVQGIIDKIEKYNGCILADSVGLGKTFTALAVIKYYELRNDRVLVLCPKKLRENWTIYTQNDRRNILVDDRFNYDVLNHTDLSRVSGFSGAINLATLNWGNYDLVVIDESHNFRNNPPVKDRVTRYERMMRDIIKSGVKTKVLMLSATPVNNRMNDIKNQIAFITEGRDDALSHVELPSIERTLRRAQAIFNQWNDLPEVERTSRTFVDMMEMDYFKLLDTLTIARSRKHIEKYYNIAEIGDFPKRLKPINCYSQIDTTGVFPPIGKVNELIQQLSLAVYSPILYLRADKRLEYEKAYDIQVKDGQSIFRQSDRERSLVALMRVNILKRLESSVYSFALTVERILEMIGHSLETINNHQGQVEPDLSILDIDPDDQTLEELMTGTKVKVLLQDMDLIKWKQALELDQEKLTRILEAARQVTPDKDQKLHDVRALMRQKMAAPINPGNKKIIIFTAFADTAKYLYGQLAEPLKAQGIYAALVTGSGENQSTLPIPKRYRREMRISDLNTVLTLFSPKSKACELVFPGVTEHIDVLIATDCISEGQNLQDCDYLINYDIHWNPVRIVQRFGRIDRIGSENKQIQLTNFWPTEDLDEYINLEQRVRGRMVLMDISATGEENLIEENAGREMKDLAYRKKQLERLQNEVVDLEDISGGISITDLTFSDFKVDLMAFLKGHREQLAKSPLGIYALAAIPPDLKGELAPGVVFTLRQVEGKAQSREQNPLFPYYLMYITQEGVVELSFHQAKKILDYTKRLCAGKTQVYADLVASFNQETRDGEDMAAYSSLLKTVVDGIIGRKETAGLQSLFAKGGTQMNVSVFDGMEDFELVAFLVLKDGQHG